MTERRQLVHRLAGVLSRAGRMPVLAILLAAGLAGCRHKATYVLPQSANAPVDLEMPSSPDEPMEIAELPLPELPPLSATPPKLAPKKKPVQKEESQSGGQVASETAPTALAIGALTTGGDAAPQSQQQAQDLIAALLKRIAALPAAKANALMQQIRQVRHFLDQAQQALNSGDAEGAMNLATKAKLLMDDLEKK